VVLGLEPEEFERRGCDDTGRPHHRALGTEPAIDSWVLYFGTTGGKVYAIITDSGGTLAPTPGSTWPRVGYDNCNSSNTAFNCQ
jgi:hypothetical protein